MSAVDRMPKGHKTFTMRGGVDHNDFPSKEISLKDIRAIGRSAWEKWGHMVPDWPIRDLIALAYAEGLWHGAMIGIRMPDLVSTIGSNPGSALSAAEPASTSKTTETATPIVRDILDLSSRASTKEE
jgi:hypothetical protein